MKDRIEHKCSVILVNEITPRAKKLGIKPYDFCSTIDAAALSKLEFFGALTRREVRQILDARVEQLRKL